VARMTANGNAVRRRIVIATSFAGNRAIMGECSGLDRLGHQAISSFRPCLCRTCPGRRIGNVCM
jgi:hypothetical protein